MAATVWLVPGLGDSGPAHWQRLWQREHGFRVVEQRDWQTPRRADWVASLEEAVASTPGPIVIAAHSLGCATVAHWAPTTRHAERVRGALLVAPADVEAPTLPPGPTGFAPMPRQPLPFAARVVASGNDPYLTATRALEFAICWNAALVGVGDAGHLNTESGHGPWPEGLAQLRPWLLDA